MDFRTYRKNVHLKMINEEIKTITFVTSDDMANRLKIPIKVTDKLQREIQHILVY